MAGDIGVKGRVLDVLELGAGKALRLDQAVQGFDGEVARAHGGQESHPNYPQDGHGQRHLEQGKPAGAPG